VRDCQQTCSWAAQGRRINRTVQRYGPSRRVCPSASSKAQPWRPNRTVRSPSRLAMAGRSATVGRVSGESAKRRTTADVGRQGTTRDQQWKRAANITAHPPTAFVRNPPAGVVPIPPGYVPAASLEGKSQNPDHRRQRSDGELRAFAAHPYLMGSGAGGGGAGSRSFELRSALCATTRVVRRSFPWPEIMPWPVGAGFGFRHGVTAQVRGGRSRCRPGRRSGGTARRVRRRYGTVRRRDRARR
jgi:hypothetical protein